MHPILRSLLTFRGGRLLLFNERLWFRITRVTSDFRGFRSIRSERPRLGISRMYWHEQPSSSGWLVHLFFHRISAISKKTRPKSTKSTHSNGRRSSTKASASWAWRRTASRTWTSSGCSSARSVSQWLKLRALFWEDIYHGVNSLPHEKNAKHF